MITTKDRAVLPRQATRRLEDILIKHISRFNNLLVGLSISKDLFSLNHRLIKGKVEALDRQIENELYNLILSYSHYKTEVEEDEEELMAFILRDRDNGNLVTLIQKYTERLDQEIEAYIESSLYFDISIATGLNYLKNDLKNAYRSDFIKRGYKEIEKPNNIILKSKGMTVKVGEYKTSVANMKRLAAFTIIEALTFRQKQHFKRLGAIGYTSHRGSSYYCPYCDSMTKFYSIDDPTGLPPYHANCYCYILPEYKL